MIGTLVGDMHGLLYFRENPLLHKILTVSSKLLQIITLACGHQQFLIFHGNIFKVVALLKRTFMIQSLKSHYYDPCVLSFTFTIPKKNCR